MRSALLLISASLLYFQSTAATDTLVKNNNQFAFDIYHRLDKTKNVFLSPFSISSALGMTYAGARGQTATEMAKAMHFEGSQKTFHEQFSAFRQHINSLQTNDLKLNVANRLFGDKRAKFLQPFLDVCSVKYDAELKQLDFIHDLEGSRKHINKWVEEKTNNKIVELLKPRVLPDSTKLVLVNAIYFYGDWASQFQKENTYRGDFHTADGKSTTCSLMHQQSGFEYLETSSFKALRMPYKGNTLSMEVYLPNTNDGIEAFEKEFTAANYTKWSKQFGYEDVNVTLPKFKMTVDFEAGAMLSDMGMPTAFTDGADFSGMTGKPDLKIAKVIHKAFVDVSEKGTEAAAATAVIMTTTDSVHEYHPPKTFKADHPFVFLIRENRTGSILFIGRLLNAE